MFRRLVGWTGVAAAAACLLALVIGYSLWSNDKALRLYIFCWPTSSEAGIWRTKLVLVRVLEIANLVLPVLSVLCVRYQPRAARRLAASELVLVTILWLALAFWHPLFPIPQ